MVDPELHKLFRDETSDVWLGGLGGMNRREEEELLRHHGTRKERKAIKAKWKAEKRAAKEREKQ